MKRNKLYTVNSWNKHLYTPGGPVETTSQRQPTNTITPKSYTLPSTVSNGKPMVTAQELQGSSGNPSGWQNFMGQVGGMDGFMGMVNQGDQILTQLGDWMAKGKTSTAGNIFNSLGASGVPGMGFIGGLVNSAFGTNFNEENIAKFNRQNALQGKSTFGSSSNEEVLSNFANSKALEDVNRIDVGSDGWLSNRASEKTFAINNARQAANAHNYSALNHSVSSLDSNKDFGLVSNYSAKGGPINRFPLGGDYTNMKDWWNNDGKFQYLGFWANPAEYNQSRIDRQQGYKTGATPQFGGIGNAMSYMSAAQDITGNLTHWGDENYVKTHLGSNGGVGASAVFSLANLIAGNAKEDRPSLTDKIGLANGGPVHKYGLGGSDYSQIAASIANLANNAVTQAKTEDISDIQSELRRRSNINFSGNTNKDLLSSWNNNYRAYNSSDISDMDIRNKSWAEDIINGFQAGSEGAVTGFQVGGIPGAIIGGIVGIGSSAAGTAAGRSEAGRKRRKLIKDIDATNAREIQTFDVLKDNLDRSNDISSRMFDFALGGPYYIQQPSSGAANYQLMSDLLGLGRKKVNNTSANIIMPSVKGLKTFSKGGYIEGNTYDIDEEEVKRLINAGYKIQYE